MWRSAALVVAAAALLASQLQRVDLPAGDEPASRHAFHTLTDIWTPEQAAALRQFVRDTGPFGTVVEDVTVDGAREHIGEAVPLGEDGRCPHALLVPNSNGTLCLLPQRMDVARHFLQTGGYLARRERLESMVPRILAFSRILHAARGQLDVRAAPHLQALFESPAYMAAASAVCGADRQVFDPIQLGIILQVPGQEVPVHYDVPYFFGATRYSVPQWLLVVMEQSGLWAARRVPQIQGVAYLHSWEPGNGTAAAGGGFIFYPSLPAAPGSVHVFPANFNAAIVVDGSKVPHGTEPFRPTSAAAARLPRLKKTGRYSLRYAPDGGSEAWSLRDEAAGVDLSTYAPDDVRISLVWRARCFTSEAERASWAASASELQVDDILDTLLADLRARGRLAASAPRPAAAGAGPAAGGGVRGVSHAAARRQRAQPPAAGELLHGASRAAALAGASG